MQTNNTFSIIFFTRKSRNAKNQLSIYVRITINKQRSEISLKRNVSFKQWDNNKNRGRGTSAKIRILNNYLDYVYNKLLDSHKQLLEEDKIISSHAIKNRFLGKDSVSKTLKELYIRM